MTAPVYAPYGGCYGRDCGPTLPWWAAVLIVGGLIMMIILIVRYKSRVQGGAGSATRASELPVGGTSVPAESTQKTRDRLPEKHVGDTSVRRGLHALRAGAASGR